ncbi:flagellar hook-associated protein FlgK [Ectothiorhodospiraceae bacterium BW-2]|nr:flagellar hook-associated protein FlgK [Ectothiorhodospiraceae bacterium BW-2]
MDLITNGRAALVAFQNALVTTSNNIANVHTEGYTRQQTEFTARRSEGGMGTGVEVKGIRRHYNEYLSRDLQESISRKEEHNLSLDLMDEIDQILVNSETGIGRFNQDFFNAVENVANDPTSIAAREEMLGRGETLASRFREVGNRLNAIDEQVNNQLSDSVMAVNELAAQIAGINSNIQDVATSAEDTPNDLLDQRDQLINLLSEYVSVKTIDMPNGTNNIYIGDGQNLVVGANHNTFSLQTTEFGGYTRKIGIVTNTGSFTDVTDRINGGKIGATLDFKEGVLQRTKDDIGLMAAGISIKFNELHQNGFDMDGDTNEPFFNSAAPAISYNSSSNSSGATVAYDYTFAPLPATNSDTVIDSWRGAQYLVEYDGPADAWKVTNQRDSSEQTFAGAGGAATSFTFNGVTLTTSGVAANGDRFLVTPFANNARDMALLIKEPRDIAASDTAGQEGNNVIAAQLAEVGQFRGFNGSTQSADMIYEGLVSYIGSKANSAKVSYEASEVIYQQSRRARDDVSGVNLDEEAANLMRYQQAYQAAAKVMSASDEMFRILIGSIRV